jgi:hypothetical protein
MNDDDATLQRRHAFFFPLLDQHRSSHMTRNRRRGELRLQKPNVTFLQDAIEPNREEKNQRLRKVKFD